MTDANCCRRLAAVLLMALCWALLAERGVAYPSDESVMEEAEPLAYPSTNNLQQEIVPESNQVEKPKNCFHFYVSRNMSSLLSDATKMLQHVRDRREREWILTFIYRIKSLAEHLRTHPESRNYDCLPSDDEVRRSMLSDHLRIPQPELYFVDDMYPNHSQKRTNGEVDPGKADDQEDQSGEANPQKTGDNPDPHQSSTGALKETSNVPQEHEGESYKSSIGEVEEHKDEETQSKTDKSIPTVAADAQSELNQPAPLVSITTNRVDTEDQSRDQPPIVDKGQYDNVFVLSSPPDCKSNIECEEVLNRHIAANNQKGGSRAPEKDDLVVQELHYRQHDKSAQEDKSAQVRQGVLKQRIRKALLEEMAPEVKKLRTVGGSKDDLLKLWKLSENESGKPSSESYQEGDFDYEEIGAAAGDLNTVDGYTTNDHTVAPSLGEIKNFKRQSNNERSTASYQPYDDSDVLVKQLFEVRYERAKTTKSLKDNQQEEYLVTSTPFPY